MIIIGYVVAMLLEIAGVATVADDIRRDRGRARELLDRPRRVRIPWPSGAGRAGIMQAFEDDKIRRGAPGAGEIMRQRYRKAEATTQRFAWNAATAEHELTAEIASILSGNLFRKLLGPGLLIAGIVIGTIANIANT